ncbi:MAG: RNA polymerase sigma factor [Polaromonas sp.]
MFTRREQSEEQHPPAFIDPRDDVKLVSRASAGDTSAFEAIMRRHNRLLFRTARGVVADDAEAQDVVQETYLRAFTGLQSFRGDASLGTWLVRIAINVAVSAQRKKGRQVQLDERVDLASEPSPENTMAFCTPETESPDALADRGQVRDLLQDAIANLPVIYRSVFILRAVEEVSVEETALCLGVSAETVRTRFLRARVMLRDTLGLQMQAYAQTTFTFAGARCDAVVSKVLVKLHARGLIRLH